MIILPSRCTPKLLHASLSAEGLVCEEGAAHTGKNFWGLELMVMATSGRGTSSSPTLIQSRCGLPPAVQSYRGDEAARLPQPSQLHYGHHNLRNRATERPEKRSTCSPRHDPHSHRSRA